MNNWCKIITSSHGDILIQKEFYIEEGQFKISVSAVTEGFKTTTGLGYNDEENRDRAWDNIPDDQYRNMIETSINFITNG